MRTLAPTQIVYVFLNLQTLSERGKMNKVQVILEAGKS